ncbi:MAG: hypothetical protein DHS20C21_10010 [Gemmatimonadota bacterium]|nr:MAG: hypothetical protein DHS20C21_10010 [Gemmatimonadota bacterium]
MKALLKTIAALGCRLLMLPLFLYYRVACVFIDSDKAFHGASQAVATLPGLPGEFLRREFYRLALEECSPDCCISFGTILSKRGSRIGRRVYVGTYCTLGLVTLEDDVLLASNVDVLSGAEQHRFTDPDTPVREQGGDFRRVTIGRDTWVGNRSVVMANVGSRCVVGAGSVVTRELADRSVAVGSPARVVGTRGETQTEAAGSHAS